MAGITARIIMITTAATATASAIPIPSAFVTRRNTPFGPRHTLAAASLITLCGEEPGLTQRFITAGLVGHRVGFVHDGTAESCVEHHRLCFGLCDAKSQRAGQRQP